MSVASAAIDGGALARQLVGAAPERIPDVRMLAGDDGRSLVPYFVRPPSDGATREIAAGNVASLEPFRHLVARVRADADGAALTDIVPGPSFTELGIRESPALRDAYVQGHRTQGLPLDVAERLGTRDHQLGGLYDNVTANSDRWYGNVVEAPGGRPVFIDEEHASRGEGFVKSHLVPFLNPRLQPEHQSVQGSGLLTRREEQRRGAVRVVHLGSDAREAISSIRPSDVSDAILDAPAMRGTSRGYGRNRDMTARAYAEHAADRLRYAQDTGTYAYMPVSYDDWVDTGLGARLGRWARGS